MPAILKHQRNQQQLPESNPGVTQSSRACTAPRCTDASIEFLEALGWRGALCVWAVVCVGAAPAGSVVLVLGPRGHHHLLAPKVPEGGHMEGHVGDHHHVLAQRKQGVDWKQRETAVRIHTETDRRE